MVEENKGKHLYDDLINLAHHVSDNRKRMSIHDRAAQFSPFAAVTGLDGAIKETARLTDQRIKLDESEKVVLDEKLKIIQKQLAKLKEIEIEFFEPDEQKVGGVYLLVRGVVNEIDKYKRVVVMQDGTRIKIEEIVDITGEIFLIEEE